VKYSGGNSNWSNYPENVRNWAFEILNLGKYAPYGKWVVKHPDGREKIAYRAGRYIIDEAVKHSGKSILELTDLAPIEVINISGLMDDHVNSYFKLAEFHQLNNNPQLAIQSYEKAATLSVKYGNSDDAKKYFNRVDLINHPISFDENELKKLAGKYSSTTLSFTIENENGRLYVRHKGWPKLELIPESKNKFYMWSEMETFKFIYGKDHKIEKLIFNNSEQDIKLIKQN